MQQRGLAGLLCVKPVGALSLLRNRGLLHISILISNNDTKANFLCEEELLIK